MSGADVSIVYVTCRAEPRFDWFADGLARQLGDGDDVELVVVDGAYDAARGERWRRDVGGRFAFRHVPAKPSPWNGPQRLTSRDYFAAASARNTGLVHARRPYVVFADDASVPMPGWWAAVGAAARRGDVVGGAYQKRWEMRVEDGLLVGSRLETAGVDVRWPQGDDRRPVEIAGNQLYAPSLGAPRAVLLAINGYDELCDSIGGEDWHLGARLAFSVFRLWYDRRMLTIESEDLQRVGPVFLRDDPLAAPEAYRARLARYGLRRRHVEGRCDASHMLVDIAYGTGSPCTQGNYYWLADLDETGLAATIPRFPRRRWFDDLPLAAL
jgi:hypothetical protein